MAKQLRYSLIQFDGKSTLTLFHGSVPLVANDEHPNWEAILQGVTINDDPAVADLFDITHSVAKKFQRLGSRVVARDNRIYFDGDEVNNTLTKKIMEFIEAGVDDWQPLVRFMEQVFDNPEEHSRVQLFDWLSNHAFSINQSGEILGYKGVNASSRDGFTYESVRSGSNQVTVEDQVFTGHVPQNVGSVVEMARSEVAFDPSEGCGSGLHVANYRYAAGWGPVVLLIAVSPRDVVSVPTDSNWEKVRVCRYRVVEVVQPGTERYEEVNPLHREAEEEPEVQDDKPKFGITYPSPFAGGTFTITDPNKVTTMNVNTSGLVEKAVQPGGFKKGDRVTLVDNVWHGTGDMVYDDLYENYELHYGSEGVVGTSIHIFTDLSAKNVFVNFGSNKELWVAPTSLILTVDEDEDSWDLEDDSWSW